MFNSGNTPLIRARQLEKKLNVGRIYLKLEGTNPTGHMIDRIAELSVFNAKKNHFNHIIAYGGNHFLKAMSYFASQQNIKLSILKKTKNQSIQANYIEIKSHKKNIQEKVFQYAKEMHAYLAFEEEQIDLLKNIVYSQMTDELLMKTKNEVDHIYISHHYRNTTKVIEEHMFKRYIEQTIETMPKIIYGYNENQKEKISNDNLSQMLTPMEKIKMARLLRQNEQIKIPAKDTLAFGAFYKDIQEGKIKKGNHVIVLENAKTYIDVKRIYDFNEETKEELIQMAISWLVEYQDSILETKDAIESALKNGYILTAQYQQKIEGICVIVNTGFEAFIPSFHLAYIATDPLSKGRGVGTELIQRAIDLTDGSLSLHVDLNNKSARRLYEKMGFKLKYYRMIYEQK
jgi:threonine synthase